MNKEKDKSIKIEGEETLNVENNEDIEGVKEIYPLIIKVSRDMFSILDLKRKYEIRETIVLDPDFQRNDVWNKKQKSELVESILMGMPLPVMYFAEDKYGKLQVIDGRQRLTALFEYLNNEFPIFSAPILKKKIKGKRFNQLEPKEQAKIEDYQLIIYRISPQTPDRVKFDIFDRVNRGGTQLNKQEMRNALYQGKSTELIKELSKSIDFQNAINKSIDPKRMKDRYLILRFISFYLWRKQELINNKEIIDYKSNIDDFLGKSMEFLNNLDNNKIEKLKEIFLNSMKNTFKILQENAFRIPILKKKRPINMALFESLSYLMSFNIVNNNIEATKINIKDMFSDKKFLDSLTLKIDSSVSVATRFDKMDKILRELESGE